MNNLLFLPLAKFKRLYRRLWLRVTLYALVATTLALVAGPLAPFVPAALAARITPDAVLPVLTILATSLLAVTTFSLNVMVTAHRQAAANTTPRVHRLLLDDTTTQAVLAVFLGTFIYALLSIILFRGTLLPDRAAPVTLAATVGVVALVIVAMVRWIDHLSTLGSLDDTLRLSISRARPPLDALKSTPARGATPITEDTVFPQTLRPVPAPCSGYVQLINIAELAECAGEDAFIYIGAAPGSFVLEGTPLAHVAGTLDAAVETALPNHFVIGDNRTGEQDPEIGLITLSEIASRALSPAVNDPGTAVTVSGRVTELLWDYGRTERSNTPPAYPHVFLAEIGAKKLVRAGFHGLARDGVGMAEVRDTMLDHLDRLSKSRDTALARAAAEMRTRVEAQSRSTSTEPTE